MDTKATVHIGDYSRYGRSRALKSVEAWDHDMRPKEKLVPGGILEPVIGKAFLFFTDSNKTSDFLVDGLLLWWKARKRNLSAVKQLVIKWTTAQNAMGTAVNFCSAWLGLPTPPGLWFASSTTRPITASTMVLSAIGQGLKSHGMGTC